MAGEKDKGRSPAVIQPEMVNPLVVPSNDPTDENYEDWFNPVSGRSIVTKNNEVIAYTDGRSAFKAMADAIKTADSDVHFVYLLAWDLHLDFMLVPGNLNTTIRNLFDDLTSSSDAAKRVKIRAMLAHHTVNPLTGSTVSGVDNQPMVDFINGLKTGSAIHDDRTLQETILFSSRQIGVHHQKAMLVYGNEGLYGFFGGIDINPNRITPANNPLHDVHCRVRGAAAEDLERVFRERWNEHPDVTSGKRPTIDLVTPSFFSGGDKYVQLACTYGNGQTHGMNPPYAFAPTGDQSARRLIHHAISRARRFIYIEDQYLVDMGTSQVLADNLQNIEALIILICQTDSINGELQQAWRRRDDFIANLKNKDASKVIVCDSDQYVHSKLFIFDDKFAIVGSANCNRRGYTYDSEIVAGIYDPNVAGRLYFPHELRIRLWMKHLRLPAATLSDPIAAAIHWKKPHPPGKVHTYVSDRTKDPPNNLRDDMYWDTIIDPDGS